MPLAALVDSSSLLTVLQFFHPLKPATREFIENNVVLREVRKGKMLLKSGDVCQELYFIQKGALRGFMREDDKDITTWFSVDNEVVTSISGLNDQAPSIENIQAIEHSTLLVMSFETLKTLYQDYLEFNIVGRKLLERYYQDAEGRAFIARIPGTERRYLHFVKTYPHLINRIPIKYIASFLGVTLETMSRVRKRMC